MFELLDNTRLFITFFLMVVRIAAVLFTAPVFGSTTIKANVRIALSMVIGLVCLHSVPPIAVDDPDTITIIVMIAKEILLGACMGMLSHYLFTGVMFGGQLLGIQMGFSVANVYDPQSNTSVSIIASFLNIAMILIFIAVGGHLMVIQAINASFQTLPLGIYPVHEDAFLYIVKQFTYIFITAIKITAPAFVTLMILHVVMGIIGRMVPQINLMIVGFPIQIAVGLSVLALSMNYFYLVFEKLMHRYFEQVANLIRYL